jgi:hypothetical protein
VRARGRPVGQPRLGQPHASLGPAAADVVYAAEDDNDKVDVQDACVSARRCVLTGSAVVHKWEL